MIWCVEDDASIRDIEVYALQSTGFEARGFEDRQCTDSLYRRITAFFALIDSPYFININCTCL